MVEYIYDNDKTDEVWKLIEPGGRTADFYSSSQKRAEDYMIAEALVGGMATREEMLAEAGRIGYKIERVK